MEEEKKVMPEIENSEIQTDNHIQNNVLNNLEQEPKKHTGLIITILVIFILALGFYIIYDKFYKNSDKPKDNNTEEKSTPIPPTPGINNDGQNVSGYDIPVLDTDSSEIKIAKQKLKMAFNFFDSSCSMVEKEKYSEDGNGASFCYFDTLDNFKNKFYSIYSKELDYKDVYAEYEPPYDINNYSTNVKDGGLIYGYVIKNNKVYQNDCTVGSGNYERMDKFVVESTTDDTIKVNYKVIYKDQLVGGDEYEKDDAQIVLVKENNDWKILNATIVNMCNSTYQMGK